MQRYFIVNNQIKNNFIYITGDDYHHIKNVIRMKVASEALFCNENQEVFLGSLFEILRDKIVFKIIKQLDDQRELFVDVVIAQGLIRRNKQEEVIRRLVELGASKYIPVVMDRSVVKASENQDSKRHRIEKIVKEASEQSHRNKLLEISDIITFNELINISTDFDLVLYAYENKRESKYFKQFLTNFSKGKILVLVGPEGGISDREVSLLNDNKFLPIGLGPRILRTETAPLYIMSAISYELELGERNES